MPGGFQTQVTGQPAPAVEGDFASRNPYFTFDAGPGGLVAGPNNLTIARFAWVTAPVDPNGTPTVANNYGFGPVDGFVHRDQQGTQVEYLAYKGMQILKGMPATLMIGGDFWVRNAGSGEALRGMKAYADLSDGSVSFAASGSPSQGFSMTGSIAASTFSVTASIANNVMNVSAVGSGVVVPGGAISGTGVASGSKVVSQLTPLLTGETLGGVGRYYVSIPEQTVASTTVSGTYGTLTISAATTGAVEVSDIISGSGVTSGTTVTALGTGTGGVGTYIVDPTQNAGSTTITGSSNVETKWYAVSTGLTGEIVKITDHPAG